MVLVSLPKFRGMKVSPLMRKPSTESVSPSVKNPDITLELLTCGGSRRDGMVRLTGRLLGGSVGDSRSADVDEFSLGGAASVRVNARRRSIVVDPEPQLVECGRACFSAVVPVRGLSTV